jgi:YesN/AraC family two-component response regulator
MSHKQIINSKIIKEIDTPRLIAQKEALIAQLEEEKSLLSKKSTWILGLLVISLGTMPFFIVRQRRLKRRFDALVKSTDLEVKSITKPQVKSSLSSEIIDDIMNKLKRFEEQQKYLSTGVSLQSVAKSFNTNSSYLSKVVNLHKDKNFSQYLNDLRIDYAIQELKTNARFRRYTIKAIAYDVGFGNSQSFSKAFYQKTGLQPSYFVRKLNKQVG